MGSCRECSKPQSSEDNKLRPFADPKWKINFCCVYKEKKYLILLCNKVERKWFEIGAEVFILMYIYKTNLECGTIFGHCFLSKLMTNILPEITTILVFLWSSIVNQAKSLASRMDQRGKSIFLIWNKPNAAGFGFGLYISTNFGVNFFCFTSHFFSFPSLALGTTFFAASPNCSHVSVSHFLQQF